MKVTKILVLHRNHHHVLHARSSSDYAAAPGIEFAHACVWDMRDLELLAGLRFAAVIGLENVRQESAHNWILTRIRENC